jgi:hypothetical protein
MIAINRILPMLAKVRATGPSRWVACCPSHHDRTPSLAIRAVDDGRVLLHCFGGCDIEAITGALGLTVSDLFSEPLPQEWFPKLRAPFSAFEALQCLQRETALVAIAAGNIGEGVALTDADIDRVCDAAGRITAALEVVHDHG